VSEPGDSKARRAEIRESAEAKLEQVGSAAQQKNPLPRVGERGTEWGFGPSYFTVNVFDGPGLPSTDVSTL
jgi:hypothetical protein